MNKPIIRPTTTQRAPAIITKLLPDPTWDGEKQDSIIHPEFYGFNLITGFRGKGKSTLAMSWDHPSNTLMLDFESKEEKGATDLGIGAYFPVMREVIGKMGVNFDGEQVYKRVLQIVEAIPQGRFTTLVLDNAQEFQDSCCRMIEKDPEMIKRYGLKEKHVASGGFGGALPGAKRLIANLINLAYSKGINLISTTFQLKQAWQGTEPAFNKWRTSEVTIWHEESKLTMVLTDPIPQHYPSPRAFVMKENFPNRSWNETLKKVVTIKRMPPAFPKAEPTDIYKYLDEPYDPKNPQSGETVTALEIAPFTPTFSQEQLFFAERMAKAQEKLGMTGGGE